MSKITPKLQLDIERFLFEEADLLDRHLFRDWLALFSDDIVYYMPVTTNYHEQACGEAPPPGEVACYFDENLHTLKQRVRRLETGKAWAEMPPSRTRHSVSNVYIAPSATAGEWDVRCNFMVYRSRLERQVDLFVGARVDRLRPNSGDGPRWKIARRDIHLDQATLLANNISLFF